jgi:hypothetical protein
MLTPSSYMKMEAGFFWEELVRPYQITWPHVAQGHKRVTDNHEHFDTHKIDKFVFDCCNYVLILIVLIVLKPVRAS